MKTYKLTVEGLVEFDGVRGVDYTTEKRLTGEMEEGYHGEKLEIALLQLAVMAKDVRITMVDYDIVLQE